MQRDTHGIANIQISRVHIDWRDSGLARVVDDTAFLPAIVSMSRDHAKDIADGREQHLIDIGVDDYDY